MYEIAGWSPSHPRVEVWSSRRLPFEPSGEMLALRTDIRAAVRVLKGTSNDTLDATYQSVTTDVCDVENVVFYNVGTSAFSASDVSTVRFRRRRTTPPPAPSGALFAHYCFYEVSAVGMLSGSRTLASFETAPLSGIAPFSGPWPTWAGLKRGGVSSVAAMPTGTRFMISVVVETQRASIQTLPILKPLLDGLVAGLHCHDGSALDVVAIRVAKRAEITDSEARRMLMDDSTAILGRLRLVWAFRDGVQMNPADDLIDEAVVRLRPSGDGTTRAHGTLIAID